MRISILAAFSGLFLTSALFGQTAPCACPNAVSLPNKAGCFVRRCEVPGLPDSALSGGYLAYKNILYQSISCCRPIQNQNLSTGTAAWRLLSTPSNPNFNAPATPIAFWALPAGGPGSFVGPPTGKGDNPSGTYVYELRFCLCETPEAAVLTLKVLADNGAKLFVNGALIGQTGAYPYGHVAANAFNGTIGQPQLKPGANVVRVEVTNQNGPTGLYASAVLNAKAGLCTANSTNAESLCQ